MASAQAYVDFKSFLQGRMTPIPVIDFDQIDTALQQATGQFLALEESYSEDIENGFGDPNNVCMREESEIIIHCFVPAPESSSIARALADRVANELRYQRINDLRVVRTSGAEPEGLNDGLWSLFLLPVLIHYDRHIALP